MQDGAMDGRLDPLKQAAELLAQRRQEYGPPAEHFRHVACRWSATLGTTVRPERVVLCLLDLRLARLAHDPAHWDSLVDLIGYSIVLHELVRDASAIDPAAIVQFPEPQGSTAVAAAGSAQEECRRS